MAKIRLIVEHYGTVQVAECSWRDGTTYSTVEVDVPDWLVAGMGAMPANNGLRVIGAAVITGAKEDGHGE